MTADFRAGVTRIRTDFQSAWHDAPSHVRQPFRRLVNTPTLLVTQLADVEGAAPADAGARLRRATFTANRIEGVAQRTSDRALKALQAAPPNSQERRERDHEFGTAQRFAFAVRAVLNFLNSTSSALLQKNSLLLLGGWGMGKTHSLCDLTKRRMGRRLPTLFCLAQHLPDGMHPLAAICQTTGLAPDGAALLAGLNRLGRQAGSRALLIVDAINEGDRREWRSALLGLTRDLRRYPNVGLILSCRQPFEDQIVGQRAAQQLVTLHHQGFGEIEFDAQMSFFQYYNIPAPQVPLMTPEYSRPLFLQLLCKAIAHLSRSGKHRQLKSFASGQKGMTFLLEYFAKQVGAPIETAFGLPGTTCWRILKGAALVKGGPLVGIAPLMAEQLRDYVSWDECLGAVEPFVDGPRPRRVARQLVRRMLVDGLLIEELRWEAGGQREVIRFPYQRFADHIIARSLLTHLNTASVQTIRRSFYRNRPLGRVFELAPGQMSFQRPGFASAIMLEFPERVRGHVPADAVELVFYLPQSRRLLAPFKDAFLEGLPWRSAEHFTTETHSIIASLLDRYDGRTRHYALGLISLARRLDANAVPRRQLRYLRPPFAHLPEQLPVPEALTDQQRQDTEPALHMDFDNYTLGHLIPDRQNYDSQNPKYQLARNRLLGRMSQLGYSYPRFKPTDDVIGQYNWNRDHDPNKTDRYGKKYSWIAYFELYGLRQDNGQVRHWEERAFERVSDCDIDPSFPERPPSWAPTLPDVFSSAPQNPAHWLRTGPVPRYDHLLQRTSADGVRGPWVLLNGFVEQTAPDDLRVVFSFLRGVLVPLSRVDRLREKLGQTQYPGNDAIPRPLEDHYTFAGEIPWSIRFGNGLRTVRGRARRNVQSAFERWGQGRRRLGLPIEVPVHEFGWESYHSAMNQAGGPEVPAPALCEALQLTNRPRTFDLYDPQGRQATLYRRIENLGKGRLLYMRQSTLRRYLQLTDQALVWVVWGERNFSGGSGMHDNRDVRPVFQEYRHIHKRFIEQEQ